MELALFLYEMAFLWRETLHRLIHPLVSSVIPLNKNCGDLANDKEKKKLLKYSTLSNRYDFRPIAIDSIGAYGSSALFTLKEIGKRITQFSGNPGSTLYLRQRFSIAIQKGNSIILQFALRHTKM